jgi:hypothetical protein
MEQHKETIKFQRVFKDSKRRTLKDLPHRCSEKTCPQYFETVDSITKKIQTKSNKCAFKNGEVVCNHPIEFYFQEENRFVRNSFVSDQRTLGWTITIEESNLTTNYFYLKREFLENLENFNSPKKRKFFETQMEERKRKRECSHIPTVIIDEWNFNVANLNLDFVDLYDEVLFPTIEAFLNSPQ